MDNLANKKQNVILENRQRLTIDSVINVKSFNDDYLIINTVLGEICVEGKELKIQELLQDTGKILVTGEISGIYYYEEKSNKGIFSKIFK